MDPSHFSIKYLRPPSPLLELTSPSSSHLFNRSALLKLGQSHDITDYRFKLQMPAVESEMHVLMSCDSYMDMNANNLFECANDVIDNVNSLNKENQFIVMLQSENPSLMQNYIFDIFRARFD